MQLAERNYEIYNKELLTIVEAVIRQMCEQTLARVKVSQT